jgi:predicted lipoprotein with Yx(FWY)xxD motif
VLAGSGALHLYLYFNGYGPVPTIGTLFVLQFAAAICSAVLVVATKGPVVPAGAALFALATLGGYLLSLSVGLFGFKEVPTSYGAWAGGLELAAFGVLGAVALARLALRAPRGGRVLATAARATGALLGAGALALALSLELVGPVAGAGAVRSGPATGKPTVVVVDLRHYGPVLADSSRMSLYLLSDERPGHLTCTSGCLSIWPPLLVGKGQVPRAGPGVRGHLGVLARGGLRELTYNGYPLYTYAGDSSPGNANGEGIPSFGGTWYLVRAPATSRGATPVRGG